MKTKYKLFGVSAILIGMLFGLTIGHYGIFTIGQTGGVSNGPPYCLTCVVVKSSLPTPEVGDYVSHRWNGFYVMHRIISKNLTHYTFITYGRNDTFNYSIPIDSEMRTVIFQLRLETTNDFDVAWGEQKSRVEAKTETRCNENGVWHIK